MLDRVNSPAACLRLRVVIAFAVCAAFLAMAGGCSPPAAQPKEDGLKTPKLFLTLPDICPTPDGMALDKDGNIILACPNYADKSKPAVLMKIDKNRKITKFCEVQTLAETGTACPMGIAFGPDGNLYIADNQGWAKPNGKGRILRLILKDGKPSGWEVVAHSMSHPNGVRVHKGQIYVTQSMIVTGKDKLLISGVYRFKLNAKDVKINNKLDDPNLLVTFKTLNKDCQYGADGIVFDSKGNLFIGNFGDGAVHKVTFKKDGSVASSKVFAKADFMKTTDGICVDEDDNIYVADFSVNAICVVSPKGKVKVLAKSPDCDGSKGGLDQPGEPLVIGKKLIVVNFDMVTGPDKLNSKHDKPYTMSVIDLD